MSNSDWPKVIFEILGSIGGIGAIIAFFANWWGNRIADKISNEEQARHEQELERLKTQLEITKSMVARYSEEQFTIYNKLWSSLYDLRAAGDKLWEIANERNLISFAKQLRDTKSSVEKGSIFIEDDHYQQLHTLLQVFSNYETGKKRLVELRNRGEHIDEHEVQQITANRQSLDEYVELISEIRKTFRLQLNVQAN